VVQELHEPEPTHVFFQARIFDGGLTELRTQRWATSERSLEAVGEPLLRSRSDEGETIVFESDGAFVLIGLAGGFVYAYAAARDPEAPGRALARLKELLPPPEPTAAQEVPVMFWTYSAHGPLPSMRKISVPEWSEIRENYTSATQDGLDRIMRDFRPAHGGQLILWHGDVGTGKTFASRSAATSRSTTRSRKRSARTRTATRSADRSTGGCSSSKTLGSCSDRTRSRSSAKACRASSMSSTD
jgi:hypothetical protein